MKSPRTFYASLRLLVLLNVLIKPVWVFAIDRQVQNQVGAAEYGVYFSLLNLSIVASFLTDLGFTSFFNRQVAANDENARLNTGNFFWLKILFALIYASVVFIAAKISGVERWDIIVYVVLIQIAASVFLFLRGIITAKQWFYTDAWLSVMDKSLMLLCCGTLLFFPFLFGRISIDIFLALQLISMLLAVTAAFIFLIRKGISFSLKTHYLPGREIFIQALPFGLVVLLMSAHARLDAFLLERIHTNGAVEAGVYAMSYRLLDAANMLGYLVASFMLPYIAKNFAEKKELTSIVLGYRHFLLFFSIGVSCIAVFLAPWIQELLYHDKTTNAITVLQWCLPVLVSYSLIQVYGTVLTATGHIWSFCFICLGSIVINLIINLLLIPAMGAKGCCIAAIISQGFAAIATMLIVKQRVGINIAIRSLLMYTFTAVVLSVFLYLGNQWSVNQWLLIALTAVITFLIMYLSKLFNPASLFKWWRNTSLNKHHA